MTFSTARAGSSRKFTSQLTSSVLLTSSFLFSALPSAVFGASAMVIPFVLHWLDLRFPILFEGFGSYLQGMFLILIQAWILGAILRVFAKSAATSAGPSTVAVVLLGALQIAAILFLAGVPAVEWFRRSTPMLAAGSNEVLPFGPVVSQGVPHDSVFSDSSTILAWVCFGILVAYLFVTRLGAAVEYAVRDAEFRGKTLEEAEEHLTAYFGSKQLAEEAVAKAKAENTKRGIKAVTTAMSGDGSFTLSMTILGGLAKLGLAYCKVAFLGGAFGYLEGADRYQSLRLGLLQGLRKAELSKDSCLEAHETYRAITQAAFAGGATDAPPTFHVVRDDDPFALKFGKAFAMSDLGGCDRIIIRQSALHEFSTEELTAVIAHEVAHSLRKDMLRIGLARSVAACLIAGSFLAAAMTFTSSGLFTAYVGQFVLLAGILAGFGGELVYLATSRTQEFAADEFAIRVVRPAALVNALEKVSKGGADPFSIFRIFSTHPSFRQRVANVQRLRAIR